MTEAQRKRIREAQQKVADEARAEWLRGSKLGDAAAAEAHRQAVRQYNEAHDAEILRQRDALVEERSAIADRENPPEG